MVSIDDYLTTHGLVPRKNETPDDFKRRADKQLENSHSFHMAHNLLSLISQEFVQDMTDITKEVQSVIRSYFNIPQAPIIAYELPTKGKMGGHEVGGACMMIHDIPIILLPKKRYSRDDPRKTFSNSLQCSLMKSSADYFESVMRKRLGERYDYVNTTGLEELFKLTIQSSQEFSRDYAKVFPTIMQSKELVLLHESIHALQFMNNPLEKKNSFLGFPSIASDKRIIEAESWAYLAGLHAYMFGKGGTFNGALDSQNRHYDSSSVSLKKTEIDNFHRFATRETIKQGYLPQIGYVPKNVIPSSIATVLGLSLASLGGWYALAGGVFAFKSIQRTLKPLSTMHIKQYVDEQVSYVGKQIYTYKSAEKAVLASLRN